MDFLYLSYSSVGRAGNREKKNRSVLFTKICEADFQRHELHLTKLAIKVISSQMTEIDAKIHHLIVVEA